MPTHSPDSDSPRRRDVSIVFSLCEINPGRIKEAVYHYSIALQLKPACADACLKLKPLLARQGKNEEAVVPFRKAFQLKPELAETHRSSIAVQERLRIYRPYKASCV